MIQRDRFFYPALTQITDSFSCSPLQFYFEIPEVPKYKNCNVIIQLSGHCKAMWYAMSWSLVKLMEMGTNGGMARQRRNSRIIHNDVLILLDDHVHEFQYNQRTAHT